ncbi:hypothetical protein CLOBOL_03084 [Enterocloster bolteae ATCC BAA-613]|uniref:Uncharacterized protein n=1 Tax=Enterocloster bolteae (strain ATCC BAA-613 / DSM 15670 / CCUG 46953 / JCM 12243 / WAL 16351) TaxID=411902 RepID=A8RRT1_ENTBW|nr:hypothetical protein CLOBOL_03084 [Enterocloster bolteae ATCC BAA-613]
MQKFLDIQNFFVKTSCNSFFLCYDGIINNASQLCEMFIVQSHQI